MQPALYHLWHTRLQGWVTASGNTSSLIRNAAQFTLDEAREHAVRAKDHHNEPEMLPIEATLMTEILDAEG